MGRRGKLWVRQEGLGGTAEPPQAEVWQAELYELSAGFRWPFTLSIFLLLQHFTTLASAELHFPRSLSLSLCMIASSDRSSSPSLLLYLCLHTVLPSPPLSISCFPIYFITSPCYQSPALLPSFICHPFTSTIILSPPVPSFASRSFSLAESCSVWLCSFLAVWQIDSHSADFDGEEMLLFSG